MHPHVDDPLQRQLVEMLHEAGERPVTYDDLKAVGIDKPAAMVYELQAAGWQIEQIRSYTPSGGWHVAAVRLAQRELGPAAHAT
jgi:hypothetical protein